MSQYWVKLSEMSSPIVSSSYSVSSARLPCVLSCCMPVSLPFAFEAAKLWEHIVHPGETGPHPI